MAPSIDSQDQSIPLSSSYRSKPSRQKRSTLRFHPLHKAAVALLLEQIPVALRGFH